MAGRLDKVRDLKLLRQPDGWGFWLFLALSRHQTATLTSVPIETPASNGFTAAGYVELIPPFPIHISPLVLGGIDEFGCLQPFKHFTGNAILAANVRIGWNSG